MTSEYLAKYHALSRLIQDLPSAVVAYSGGVDSTLLAFLCHKILGEKALAITIDSQLHPAFETSDAIQLAQKFGFNHRLLKTDELTYPNFPANPPNRCYYCKQELFKKLREIADNENTTNVLDGTTLSDAGDYRPGRQAAIELGVRSPLLEVGLSKEQVRLISKELNLPTWEKPSYTCLATRFPYGTLITPEKLTQVAQAEDFLRELGFRIIRVRHHQTLARIEVAPEEIPRLLEPELKERITKRFQALGFVYVTADVEGYRSGSYEH